jgi:hypothetical protein
MCTILNTYFREITSLLKSSLGARFGPRPAIKHTGFGAFPSPILGRHQLNADIFNRLVDSPKS